MSRPRSTVDPKFDVLRAEERRAVLAYLLEAGRSVDRLELAAAVAGHAHGCSPAALSDTAVETAHLGLVHNHLPRLVDAGVCTHDRHTGEVALTETAHALEPHLEPGPDVDTVPPVQHHR